MIAWVPDRRYSDGERGVIVRREEVHATIEYLKLCRKARALGWPTSGPVRAEYSLTRDPEWLVDMAINRRAGWPDDPHSRGSAMPVNGKYPKKAESDLFMWLWRTARMLNGTRVVLHPHSVPLHVRARLAHRLRDRDDY